MMKTAEHWHLLDNGLIECTICPRHCRIAEGKRGACFVRRRIGDELIAETYEALQAERGEEEKIWGSMIKQTLKRRKPGFTESYYGFRSFGTCLQRLCFGKVALRSAHPPLASW